MIQWENRSLWTNMTPLQNKQLGADQHDKLLFLLFAKSRERSSLENEYRDDGK